MTAAGDNGRGSKNQPGFSGLTEVGAVIVSHALPCQLLHRLGPEADKQPPKVRTLEDLLVLIRILGLILSFALDGSDDDGLPLVSSA